MKAPVVYRILTWMMPIVLLHTSSHASEERCRPVPGLPAFRAALIGVQTKPIFVERPDGRIVGLRLDGPSHSILFTSLGFKIGDVVRRLNGIDFAEHFRRRENGEAPAVVPPEKITVEIERSGHMILFCARQAAGAEPCQPLTDPRAFGDALFRADKTTIYERTAMKVAGLKLTGPPDNALFVSFGFKPGDILRRINDQMVPENTTGIEIGEGPTRFDIERDGRILSILIENGKLCTGHL